MTNLAIMPILAAAQDVPIELSPADTAWMLASTALVLLMTPALGYFYGGLVRSKNILNTLMMSFASLGVVGVAWALLGYSLAFAPGSSWIGGLDYVFLRGVGLDSGGAGLAIPHLLFMAYQGTFAIITAALISGAVVERMRFGPYLAFITLWSLVVYAPIAHWVWGDGWIAGLADGDGALDFAGGTVVHVNAGIAAVVAAIVVGSRKDYGQRAHLPHDVTYVLLGAALLWFGWFGFNGGSALGATDIAALAFVNTMLAPAATLVVWMLLDTMNTGKITAVGAATAIVVGLVAITPAAGFVGPLSALALGAIAAIPSYYMISYRSRTRLDDSLDVFAAHGVGGASGALLVGVFAAAVWGGREGAVDGNVGMIGTQAIALLGAALYSGIGTFVLLKALSLFTPLRKPSGEEGIGLDVVLHGEEGYAQGEGAVLVQPE
ncbi:MAG TPA: ammonia channel protein [Gemmatimonadetes bacterium]|nr:ammonia channel protein [Gemmatimonadota bacterium]|tara:strand:- start:514 stop:1818 length:1305 start_codon:yes stop_codon:yes gene_type:complete